MADPALKKNPQSQEKVRQRSTPRIDLYDEGFPFRDPGFIETTASRVIFGVLGHCSKAPDMGLIVGSSGSGKTRALQAYKREQYFVHIINCSIATRSLGSILDQLLRQVSATRHQSNYQTIESIIKSLSEFPSLLALDDAHFLSWPQMELMRSFYDRARCGVAFIAQETLYDSMIGSRKNYVWEQLISRIGIHYRLEPPTEGDVEAICQGICPELDGKCLRYLFDRARGPGKLRAVTKLLAKAAQVHVKEGVPLDVTLLKKIDGLVTFKGGDWL